MRSYLLIHKRALRRNLERIYSIQKKRIIAVLKANAYGIGLNVVAPIIANHPFVDMIAVACPTEGANLREMGIKKPILVLGGAFEDELKLFKNYSLTPVISHIEHIRALKHFSGNVHIKFDTGMGRLGFLDLPDTKNLKIVGAMTHLCCPQDIKETQSQIERFKNLIKGLRNLKFIHIQSSGSLTYRVKFATHVRVGISIFGEKPFEGFKLSFQRALELRASIISIKEVPEGYGVSYSKTFITPRKTKLGVVAIGYADGLSRQLSNRGFLYLNSQKLPIVGNITMDLTIMDLTNVDAKVGDYVEVVGPNQSFSELAKIANTIPYELMTSLSFRIKRILV
ncbi:MAG: alanine racemase [Aquificaceae bacterium]|nr:alanine racemase [Aquificaceae bacterium]MDW8237103.1 alanine racemase [Aquificaceae bacterium]